VRNDAEKLGAADVGIQREHGIGFDGDQGIGVGALERRVDDEPVMHAPIEETQREFSGGLPTDCRQSGDRSRIPRDEQVPFAIKRHGPKAPQRLIIQVRQSEIQFEVVQSSQYFRVVQ